MGPSFFPQTKSSGPHVGGPFGPHMLAHYGPIWAPHAIVHCAEGEAPSCWKIFCNSLEKMLFIGIGLHLAPAQRNLKVLDFKHFKAN